MKNALDYKICMEIIHEFGIRELSIEYNNNKIERRLK